MKWKNFANAMADKLAELNADSSDMGTERWMGFLDAMRILVNNMSAAEAVVFEHVYRIRKDEIKLAQQKRSEENAKRKKTD